MNFLNKYFLILLVLNFLLIKSYAQDNAISIKFPSSPNASNLGVYGKANVNLYTGTPNINIPLYSVSERSINVPISLDYNASGVRPNMKTSWVGLNWNLNCGGVITREVKGSSHDEVMTTGFFAAPHMAVDLVYSNNDTVTDIYGNKTTVNPIAALAASYDLEPDIFYFNFCGYTGKFFRNNNSSTPGWSGFAIPTF